MSDEEDDDSTFPELPLGSPAAAVAPAPVLHLVVAWLGDDPGRVGQSICLERLGFVGRLQADRPEETPLPLLEQRPGESRAAPPLVTRAISRRQLAVTPLDGERVAVENLGKRALLCNGAPATDCVVQAGDTLLLDQAALFLVEARPVVFPPCVRAPRPSFAFGEPDPQWLVGESPVAWALRERLAAAAASDLHVLLLGETGVGKEVAAAVVHALSPRRAGPLVARNAATMPDSLLDAELFGTARNYPNAGSPERVGLVGEAHGGHLLLDELGELGEGHQAHLLRLLDGGGEYHRLGESRSRVSDLRLIGATNRPLGALKHDLLARFGQRVRIPGLGERRSDLPLLARALLARAARRAPASVARFLDGGSPPAVRVDPHLMDALLRHRYREHVRELGRLLEIAIATSHADRLTLTRELRAELALPATTAPAAGEGSSATGGGPGAAELVQALAATEGNLTQAAARLGISRYAVYRLLKQHGLSR